MIYTLYTPGNPLLGRLRPMTKTPETAERQSEERWDRAFAGSQDELARLAQEALADYRVGRTEPF